MKKIGIIIIVLALSVFYLAYVYFSRLDTENNAKDFALQTASTNAAMVFAFQNDKSFYDIMSGQTLFQQVLGADKMNHLNALTNKIRADGTLRKLLQDETMYVSLLPDSNKTINFLYTLQVTDKKNLKALANYLKIKPNPDGAAQHTVLKLNDSASVFVNIKDNVITASTSAQLVAQANKNRKANEFTAYIKHANTMNKNVLAQLYLNFNNAPSLLKNMIAGRLNGELSVLNNQRIYAILNYNYSKEHILFNGNTDVMEAENYLNLFSNVSPQTIAIANILPENTANYTVYATDSYAKWLPKLQKLQQKTKQKDQVDKMIADVNKKYHTDLPKIFNTFIGNQFITFQLSTSEKLAAFSLSNGDKLDQLLLEASSDYNPDIRVFKTAGIISGFFGAPFNNFSRPYFTVVDNYLVVANNASTVQSFLNSYKQNRLLSKTPKYLAALNQLTNTCNISYYINPENSKNIFRHNVLLPFYRHLRADSGLRSFDTFYYQMSADKDRFITNLLLNKYSKPEVPDSLQNR
ncbi:hypothetical protein ABIB40_002855 [Pedobacter sp. UYP30]|uniref:DUF3352 domain-containing protein n=1 Tax=Pedobacter sp. UYP30 TaxID=1756400 RepID=UPI003395CE2C